MAGAVGAGHFCNHLVFDTIIISVDTQNTPDPTKEG